MAAYDDDSSDGGDDYTETNVLLGYAAKHATGDPVSHLGGAPVCMAPMQYDDAVCNSPSLRRQLELDR